jgi:hypothetical protein
VTELVPWQPGELSPPELADVANREHALAMQSLGSAVHHAIVAGQALIKAKKMQSHGDWLPWLAANFDGSDSIANRYMRVARNQARVPDLDSTSLRKALEAISKDNNGRSERDLAIAERRQTQMAQAQTAIAADPDAYMLEQADIATWRPTGVNAIITDPPYITNDAVDLHRALGDFAADVLPPGGALAIMTWQPLLPAVMRVLDRPELVYRWTAAWIYETTARTPERTPRVFDGWKPILVYHKDYIPADATYLYDTVKSPDSDKDHHEWGQAPEGFMQLVRAFTEPGQRVCDPFLGGGTTAIAALAESRKFIGCDIDPASISITAARLQARR